MQSHLKRYSPIWSNGIALLSCVYYEVKEKKKKTDA